jgi:nitrate/nitrite transporter NarK
VVPLVNCVKALFGPGLKSARADLLDPRGRGTTLQTRKTSAADLNRALWLSIIAFTDCVAVWTIVGFIGLQIKNDPRLSDTQINLLVGTPILFGSLFRAVLGSWSDQQ